MKSSYLINDFKKNNMRKLKFNLIVIVMLIFISSCSKEESTTENPKEEVTTVENFTVLKSGTFVGMNGYNTKGSVELGKDANNKAFVKTKSDFSTSFATGSVTFYLSKNQQLVLSDASSLIKLEVISKNGEHFMEVSGGLPAETFKYVIVWCAPARIQFGSAELK